jgi:hypothetical protein
MRKILTALAAVTLIGVTACGNHEDADMPDVESRRLDIALSDIDRAGYSKDDVEVVGGGMFGVVDQSNWQVCQQEPAAGEPIGSAPRLIVGRTCETDQPSEAAPDPAEPDEQASAPRIKDHVPATRETFTMPPLVGANLQDAQDVLQSFGSYLLTQTDATGMGRFQVLDSNWKVCYQVPKAGAEVPLETLVDLGAVRLDERCP